MPTGARNPRRHFDEARVPGPVGIGLARYGSVGVASRHRLAVDLFHLIGHGANVIPIE